MLHGGYKIEPIWVTVLYRSSKFTLKEEVFDSIVMATEDTLCTSMSIVFRKVVFIEDCTSMNIPHKNLIIQQNHHFLIYYYYQPTHLAGLMFYIWNTRRIYQSQVDSTEIHESLASIGPKSDDASKHSKMLVWDQQDFY
jgi:hypothetical protein